MKHDYFELDLSSVASMLDFGRIAGFIIYTNAEAGTAPWITEASLAVDWAALNPSAEEKAATGVGILGHLARLVVFGLIGLFLDCMASHVEA